MSEQITITQDKEKILSQKYLMKNFKQYSNFFVFLQLIQRKEYQSIIFNKKDNNTRITAHANKKLLEQFQKEFLELTNKEILIYFWDNDHLLISFSSSDLPIIKSPYYVTSTDSFMSNWGTAENKTNKCIVPCSTYEQANKIFDYLSFQRTDQKYINIRTTKPYYSQENYYVSNLCEWLKQIERKE